MSAATLLDCFVNFDPESDVATLKFAKERKFGGSTLELFSRSGLAGLLRLNPSGEFDELEVLGATRALPQHLAHLTAPPATVRDYYRGVFGIPVSRFINPYSVTIKFTDTETVSSQHTIAATNKKTAALVATVQRDSTGAWQSLTIYDTGPLLNSFLTLL